MTGLLLALAWVLLGPPTPSGAAPVAACDPGFGTPRTGPGCERLETGWLTADGNGQLTLAPLRTLHNGAEGRAYAEAHDLEFPFSNDYHDAPDGPPGPFTIGPRATCTGAIVVGYRSPLEDHVVDCAEMIAATAVRPRVTVAVWRDEGGEVVQVSELYRP